MSKTIYIGNIPWSLSEDQLKEYFSQHGQVLSARIITERATGRSKGYGFIEVSAESAEKIIDLNGTEMDGRKLVVNEAKPRLG
ncbi:MAG: RNA-binding protein [Clostridium sp.]|nr:RNA-binding protein [Clostridium sp.]